MFDFLHVPPGDAHVALIDAVPNPSEQLRVTRPRSHRVSHIMSHFKIVLPFDFHGAQVYFVPYPCSRLFIVPHSHHVTHLPIMMPWNSHSSEIDSIWNCDHEGGIAGASVHRDVRVIMTHLAIIVPRDLHGAVIDAVIQISR